MLSILLTRPEPSLSILAKRLAAEGFDVHKAPLAIYNDMRVKFPPLNDFSAILFSSAHAVRVFCAQNSDRTLPVFAVGDATAQAASDEGFKKVWSADGAGEDLLRLVTSRKDDMNLTKILHPTGEDTAQDFISPLAAQGIMVERIVVYRAALVDILPDEAAKLLRSGDCDAVLFFSARAAAQFVTLIQNAVMEHTCVPVSAIAISARVADALKPLPWRNVHIASSPHLEAVIDILRQKVKAFTGIQAMPADPVIEAFGGIRPLASRLGLPASTVQGWKKRGIIPQARVSDVLHAAREDNIDLQTDRAMSDNNNNNNNESEKPVEGAAPVKEETKVTPPPSERRGAPDRRQKFTSPDRRGHVRVDTYAGKDRRTGLDRREYMERQRQRIHQEKMAFVNRSVLTFFCLFIPIVLLGVFVMAPEYFNLKQENKRIHELQAQMEKMHAQLGEIKKQPEPVKNGSIGASINRGIENIDNIKNSVTSAATTAANSAVDMASDAVTSAAQTDVGNSTVQAMLRVLSNITMLQKTPEGRLALKRATERLNNILVKNSGDKQDLVEAVAVARKQDPALNGLMGHVDAKDLGAAAMLVALNEFRGNVSRERPFENDIALLSKLSGNDPAMKKALIELAPYAKSGVLSQEGLRREFKSLAMEIVMAKLQGEDLSVQEKVLKRMDKYVKMRKTGDIKGVTTDAVVARAQLLLDQGDVKGAMRELQTLKGAPADAAAPFLDQAAGNLIAEGASSDITSSLLSQVTGGVEGFSMDGLINSLQEQVGTFNAPTPQQ